MNQRNPRNTYNFTDAPRRFCGWIVSNFSGAKQYARSTNVSFATSEKRRQGVVPESFITEQAKLTRETGAAWFLATFADELEAFAKQKEAEARHARQTFQNLRRLNQGRAVDPCDLTIWDRDVG